jgi:hypothetical protein
MHGFILVMDNQTMTFGSAKGRPSDHAIATTRLAVSLLIQNLTFLEWRDMGMNRISHSTDTS